MIQPQKKILRAIILFFFYGLFAGHGYLTHSRPARVHTWILQTHQLRTSTRTWNKAMPLWHDRYEGGGHYMQTATCKSPTPHCEQSG